MKRKFIFVLIIFISICFIMKVKAATYECTYTGGPDTESFVIEYDTTNGTYNNKSEKKDGLSKIYSYSYEFYQNEISDLQTKENGNDTNVCPKLYLSYTINRSGIIRETHYYNFYSDKYFQTDAERYACLSNTDPLQCLITVDRLVFGNVNYFYVLKADPIDPTDPTDPNKDNETSNGCYQYEKYYGIIEENYTNYNSCKGSNSTCAKYIEEANNAIDTLKEFCHQGLNNRDLFIRDLERDENVPDICLQMCLDFNYNLDQLKKTYGIDVSEVDYQKNCGLTQKLLVWLNNIVKWVKYILPVIVIILGILDFIKAVGADKEDDMKKAQGRFIKRLIAAALVFIVPLIIQFILEKMGFSSSMCGIKF